MPVSRDDAATWFRGFYSAEIHPRFMAARPKLKDFEAMLLVDKSRNAVIAALPHVDDVNMLAGVALAPLGKLRYLKRSEYARPEPKADAYK